jgi:LysM repeat protein
MRIEKGSGIGPSGANFLEHNVQQGDTLDSISTKYNVTKDALLESNRHLTGGELQPGQTLQIPQTPASPDTNTVEDQVEPFISDDMIKFAPPYVPVGPVVDPMGVAGGEEVTQVNLTSDQFQINPEGNLVITNPDLIQFFKNLTENSTQGQDVTLGIAKLKPPEE